MQGKNPRAVPRAGETDQTPAVNHRSQSRPPAICASRSDRARCTQHLAVLAYASACTTARQRAASRQPLRAIHRELESSRPIGGVARRWRRPKGTGRGRAEQYLHCGSRSPAGLSAAAGCCPCFVSVHRELGEAPSSAGWDGLAGATALLTYACLWYVQLPAIGSSGRILPSAGKDGRCDGRPRPMYPSCSASLCVCLHHLSVVCDRSNSSSSCRRPPMLVPST